jgi:hypothetical protein
VNLCGIGNNWSTIESILRHGHPSGFLFQESVVDVVNEDEDINEMNDCSKHVLFEGKSLPFKVDEVLHKI